MYLLDLWAPGIRLAPSWKTNCPFLVPGELVASCCCTALSLPVLWGGVWKMTTWRAARRRVGWEGRACLGGSEGHKRRILKLGALTGFSGQWNYFAGHCHSTCMSLNVPPKLRESTTPSMNPNINHELWVMMCPCRVTGCNKRTILVGMLVMEEVGHLWQKKDCWKSLYSNQFCWEPKTAFLPL